MVAGALARAKTHPKPQESFFGAERPGKFWPKALIRGPDRAKTPVQNPPRRPETFPKHYHQHM